MAYKKMTYRYKNAIEVEEHHIGRYGAPGERRNKKKKPTKEQIADRNRFNKEKVARRKLRRWMKTNDYFSDLTFKEELRPGDMKETKEIWAKFIREVRREYKKRGHPLRWFRNIEVGTKNAWHIHIIVNRIPDTDIILASAWKHGHVKNKLLYEAGEFRELAKYITKSPETDPRLKESSYSTSRNMPLPKPEKKLITRRSMDDEPVVRKGWYLDKESYYEGINAVTGHKYRCYTLIRLNRRI